MVRQAIRYFACGVFAVLVHNSLVLLLSTTLFPSLHGQSQAESAHNQTLANLVAWPVSNLVAYGCNVRCVFERGRHSIGNELLLFSAINGLSSGIGILAGPVLRQKFGTDWWTAQVTLVGASALVNFVCRKFVIFKG